MKTTKTSTGTADLPSRQKLTSYPKPIVTGPSTKALGGFTLVELIVVITILVILGTIAFIQLGGFAGSARDSARISNLNSLKTGLDLVQIKSGSYPLPEGNVSIMASGVIIGYQGYAGEQVGSMAKLSPGGTIDPSDATIFTTYSVNLAQTKMQAMTFLEDSSTATAFNLPRPLGEGWGEGFMSQANASSTSDYSKRYPKTIGDSMGILLENNTGTTNNRPIQEKYDINSFTGVDVLTSTGGLYKAYITSTSTISGTGNIFIPLLTNYDSTIGAYPGCDTKDIKLPNGQIWAACNVGATTVFKGTQMSANDNPIATTANAGKFFQWGENVAWTYSSGTGSSDNCLWNRDTQSCGVSVYGTGWQTIVSDTQSGGVDRWYSFGDIRGPCASGYHVPTQSEWNVSTSTLSSRDIFASILKLPMMGYRFFSAGYITNIGSYIFYWSSSSNLNLGYSISFSPTVISPIGGANRTWGFPVRCLKN